MSTNVCSRSRTSTMDLAAAKRKANDADYIKNLLALRKETAIAKLSIYLPLMSAGNVEAKNTILKILPVYLSYAEVFARNLNEMLRIIRLLQGHPLFLKEKSLFNAWYVRLLDVVRRKTQHGVATGLVESPKTKNCSNKFVNIPGTDFVDTIGYAELEFFNSYHRFLKFHKLHKYLYFFANLSYVEIAGIDETNIRQLEAKVDIMPMTTGARKAILKKMAELNDRKRRLLLLTDTAYFSGPDILEKSLEEVRSVLRTPIRGCTIYSNRDDLPNLLAEAIETISSMVRNGLQSRDPRFLPVADQLIFVLKRAWSCYFFSNEQKTTFNHSRMDIDRRKKNCRIEETIVTRVSERVPVVLPVGTNERTNPLDDLIIFMENWLSTSL